MLASRRNAVVRFGLWSTALTIVVAEHRERARHHVRAAIGGRRREVRDARAAPAARAPRRRSARRTGANSGASVSPASATASRSCTSGIENVRPSMPTSRNACARSGSAPACPRSSPAIRCSGKPSRAQRVELAPAHRPRSRRSRCDIIDVFVISAGSRPTSSQWPLEHAEQVPRPLGVAEEVAAVGVLGDHAQRLALAAAADRGSGCRRAAASGCCRRRVTEWCVPATVACSCGEHRARDPQVVLEPLEALLQRRERVAVGVVLVLEPAGADPVERAAAGDDVERRRDLGVLRRIAVADAADEQPERDRRRARRERRRGSCCPRTSSSRRADAAGSGGSGPSPRPR